MYTIPHFYNFKNLIKPLTHFERQIKDISNPTIPPSINNYTDVIEEIAITIKEVQIDLFKQAIQKIDDNFKYMPGRVDRYYIKDNRERTIITPFGEITFNRTIYQCRHTNRCYTHVDRFLGLPKYDRYDPTVKSMIIELYADQNSMIKVGKIIGDRIHSAFTLSEVRHYNAIPRQTIFNIVSKSKKYIPTPVRQEHTPSILFIMADEKFIATQGSNKKKVMAKAGVIFEGPSFKENRVHYEEKYYHLAITDDFWNEVYDKVCQRYDIDKIKQIYIMGDGAPWIKNGCKMFKRNKAKFVLDRFHLQQSMTRITRDYENKKILNSYIYGDDKKSFNKLSKNIIKEADDSRQESIKQEFRYINNNWNAIQTMEKEVIVGCAMEGTISHTLASIFTSVPKAYKKEYLKLYLQNRELKLNGYDLRKTHLKTYNSTKEIVTDNKPLNFSMFEERTAFDKATSSNFIKGFIAKH